MLVLAVRLTVLPTVLLAVLQVRMLPRSLLASCLFPGASGYLEAPPTASMPKHTRRRAHVQRWVTVLLRTFELWEGFRCDQRLPEGACHGQYAQGRGGMQSKVSSTHSQGRQKSSEGNLGIVASKVSMGQTMGLGAFPSFPLNHMPSHPHCSL